MHQSKALLALSVGIVSGALGLAGGSLLAPVDFFSHQEAVVVEFDPFEGVAIGNIELVREAIESGSDVNASNDADESLLHLAVATGDHAMAGLLIGLGAEINKKDKQGYTPLAQAVIQGDLKIVQLLMDKGAKPEIKISLDDEEISLPEVALLNGSIEILNLLDKDMAAKTQAEIEKVTLGLRLIESAKSGDLQDAFELSRNADVNTVDEDGWTALIHAASNAHPQVVKILLEANANVDAISSMGVSALIAGVMARNNQVVEYLVRAGADQTFLVENQYSAFDIARLHGDDEIMRLLDTPENYQEEASIFTSIRNRDLGLVMSLISEGAEVLTEQDQNGWTPLMHAVDVNLDEISLAILDKVNGQAAHSTPDGVTPLMLAAKNGNSIIANKLLEEGAQIEINSKGVSIPDMALKQGHKALAEQLKDILNRQTEGLQRELALFGLNAGPWDGVLGNSTYNAVSELAEVFPETRFMTHAELKEWLYSQNQSELYYCNNSSQSNLWFAIAYTSAENPLVSSRGWYKIAKNKCGTFRISGTGIVAYVHANGWGSADNQFCVDPVNAFNFSDASLCSDNNYAKRNFIRFNSSGIRIIANLVD